jgi:hypothetical protein
MNIYFYADGELGKKRCAMFGGAGMNSLTLDFLDSYSLPHSLRADFAKVLEIADKEHVDVHLGNHVWSSRHTEKLAKQQAEGGNPFVDENCWHEFIAKTKKSFESMVAKEGRLL